MKKCQPCAYNTLNYFSNAHFCRDNLFQHDNEKNIRIMILKYKKEDILLDVHLYL